LICYPQTGSPQQWTLPFRIYRNPCNLVSAEQSGFYLFEPQKNGSTFLCAEPNYGKDISEDIAFLKLKVNLANIALNSTQTAIYPGNQSGNFVYNVNYNDPNDLRGVIWYYYSAKKKKIARLDRIIGHKPGQYYYPEYVSNDDRYVWFCDSDFIIDTIDEKTIKLGQKCTDINICSDSGKTHTITTDGVEFSIRNQ
jgi:hypothetical protein